MRKGRENYVLPYVFFSCLSFFGLLMPRSMKIMPDALLLCHYLLWVLTDIWDRNTATVSACPVWTRTRSSCLSSQTSCLFSSASCRFASTCSLSSTSRRYLSRATSSSNLLSSRFPVAAGSAAEHWASSKALHTEFLNSSKEPWRHSEPALPGKGSIRRFEARLKRLVHSRWEASH